MGTQRLKVLQKKKNDLEKQLQATELWKQLKEVENHLESIENEKEEKGVQCTVEEAIELIKADMPVFYEDKLSWKDKVLWVLGVIKAGYVSDIVGELKMRGIKLQDELLSKKVKATLSKLKGEGRIRETGAYMKNKYYIPMHSICVK